MKKFKDSIEDNWNIAISQGERKLLNLEGDNYYCIPSNETSFLIHST